MRNSFEKLSFRLKIKEIRKEHRFSLSDVATELGFKTPSSLHAIEGEKNRLDIWQAWKLSKIFNRPMEELIEVTDEFGNPIEANFFEDKLHKS